MVPPPPMTPPRKPSDGTKTSSSKNNNNMNDGQEFGLVPKYLWKKHQHQKNNNSTTTSSRSKDSSSSLSTASTMTSSSSLSSFSPNSSSSSSSNNKDSQRSNASTTSSTDPNNAPTTIMMKDTEIVSSSSVVLAKEADDNDIPTSAEKEITKLLQETNDILAKQWSVAKLVDSKAFERQKEIILRTEHYQTKAAANRIHGNLECKSEWFLSTAAKNDPSFLGSPISLQHVSKQPQPKQGNKTDNNNDNIIGVEDGHVRLLPVRDLAGRAIVYYRFDPELYNNNNKNQFCKILYYMLQSALEDEETVNKGIVLVVWNQKKKSTSPSSTPNYLFGQFFEELLDPFWQHWSNHIRKPFKIAKLHYCTIVGGGGGGGNHNNHDDDTSVPYSIQEKQDGDVDLRIHKGSLHECLHGLVTYGIPSHFLPPAVDDENDTAVVMGGSNNNTNNNHLQWIELRRRIESFTSSNNNEEEQIDFVLVPNREDVLLGKQRKVAIHGNIIFHQLIFDNKEAYYYNGNNNNNNNADNTNSNNNDDDETTPTTTKDKLCVQIWNEIKAREGRFLQQVEGGQIWELLDKEDAVDKIRQAFNFICAQYFESDPTMTPSSSSTPSSKQRQQQRHAFDWSDPFLNFNEIFNTSQCWNLEQNCRIGGTGVGASPAKKLFW